MTVKLVSGDLASQPVFVVSDIAVKNDSLQFVVDLKSNYKLEDDYNLRVVAFNDEDFLKDTNFSKLSFFQQDVFLPQENFYFNQKRPLHEFLISDYSISGNKMKIKMSDFIIDDYFAVSLTFYNASLGLYHVYVVNIIENSNFLRTIYDFRVGTKLHNYDYKVPPTSISYLLEKRPLFSKLHYSFDASDNLRMFFAFDAYKTFKKGALFPGLMPENSVLLQNAFLSTVIVREQLFDLQYDINTERSIEYLDPNFINLGIENGDGFIYFDVKDADINRKSQYKYSVAISHVDITMPAAELLLADIDEAIANISRYRDSDLAIIRSEVNGIIPRIVDIYGDDLPEKYKLIIETFTKPSSALFSEKIDLILEMLGNIYNRVATKMPLATPDKHFGKDKPRKMGLTEDSRLGNAPRNILARNPIINITHNFRNIIKYNNEQDFFVPTKETAGIRLVLKKDILDFSKTNEIITEQLIEQVEQIPVKNKIKDFSIKKILGYKEFKKDILDMALINVSVEEAINIKKQELKSKPIQLIAYESTMPADVEYLANYNIDPIDGKNSVSSEEWKDFTADVLVPGNVYLLGRIKDYQKITNNYFLIYSEEPSVDIAFVEA